MDGLRLLFLGSSFIYPKLAAQPIREEALLTGPLDPPNEWYAIAKITGSKALMSPICMGRATLPPHKQPVLPALIRRFHEAAHVYAPSVAWAAKGTPLSELLNVGTGVDLTTREPTAFEGRPTGIPANPMALRSNSWM